ncbi:hypothetical protein [Falsiroseomonas sp. HW251]|uniref:hypothetical protein n=1 Tax=Falsiroseomonas sp. HW251 TaxID=3390998 RepID=UPI003D3223B3
MSQGSVAIEFQGRPQRGEWALADGVLTVTHESGRRRAALLDSAPEDLAAPLLHDILRSATFTEAPEDRRGRLYADGSAYTTLAFFVGTWGWLGWAFGWPGILLGWLPGILVGGMAGIVWPVAVPVAALALGWWLF